jgi:excisionase family DNA binding protein
MSVAQLPQRPPSSIPVARVEADLETGWVSLDDAATWLGTSRRYVEELLARSELPAKKFGRAVRIRFADLQEWAARQPDWRP